MKPKVSVVVTTYNGSRFLKEQLQSILEQSRQPDEVIISDDCSQDNSLTIAREFAKKAPFTVKIIKNQKNLGVVKNFEKGILSATGDIIFLSDQDDFWLPHKIETYIKIFQANPQIGYVFSDLEVVDEKLQPLNRGLYNTKQKLRARSYSIIKNLAFEDLISIKIFVNGSTSAFRKSMVSSICPIPITSNIHDGWIAMVIAAQTPIYFLPKKFTLYRQHSTNVIGYRGFSLFSRILSALKETPQRKKNEIEALEYLIKRLNYIQNTKVNSNVEVISSAIKFAASKNNLLIKQLANLSSSSCKPIVKTARHLLLGHYHKYFQGLKSFATDLLSAITT